MCALTLKCWMRCLMKLVVAVSVMKVAEGVR